MRTLQTIRCALFVVALAAGWGCSSSVHPVKGTVRFSDGTPLTIGRVVAYADKSEVGSWGYLKEDGSFEMGTHSHNDGVPLGIYQIAIENAVTAPPPGYSSPVPFVSRPLIHARFADRTTSSLTFEVPKDTVWEIVVEKP
ncbi:MAG: hypothetical protein LC104_13810 [Bacteroidales bacterium]|nr:hypothetical protein [Bacteroidales bacterium]